MIKPYYETELGKLYHGDCLEILPQLTEKVDLVLTDPPYGLGDKMQGGTWGSTFKEKMTWDREARQEWIEAILRFPSTYRVIWGGNYYILPVSRGWLSWFKPDSPPTMSDFELAWTDKDMTSKQLIVSIGSRVAEKSGHPTQKPLKLMLWCLKLFSNGTVLDPFLGSGTTAVACERLGRRWIGIEISKEYCDIAVKRIERERSQLKLCL